MAVISVGGTISVNESFSTQYTILNKINPCTGTGTISSVKLWALNFNAIQVRTGTFYGSGTSYTSRDNESIGTVTYGSEQTFSGLDCAVETNDLIGVYVGGNDEENGMIGIRSTSPTTNMLYASGSLFTGTNTYFPITYSIYLYGEGTGEVPASGVEYNGVTISELNGVAIASLNKA